MKKTLLICSVIVFWLGSSNVFAQEGAIVFGDLQLGQNFYLKDSKFFGDTPPPQYDNQKMSTDGWLSINYQYKFITAGIRYDMYLNSGLRDPLQAYTNNGIGNWFIDVDLGRLDITGGFIYDQFGSGAAFRAFEERAQLLDYALQGLRLKYELSDNWKAKFLVGKQKLNPLFAEDLTDTYPDVIMGLNLEGFVELGQGWSLAPGASIVNRTLSQEAYNNTKENIINLPEEEQFELDYNTYVSSIYANLSNGGFSLSGELNYKSPEASLKDVLTSFELEKKSGLFFLGSASYATKGFGFTLQYRKVNDFDFRTSPELNQNNGLISYIPSFSQQNTYRLTSLYVPVAQLKDEEAIQGDLLFKLNKKNSLELNGTYILNSDEKLYHEIFITHKLKVNKQWRINYGVQFQDYRIAVYNNKEGSDNVKTITPFADVTYKLGKRNSFRAELSHLSTEQDQGDWSWVLAELNLRSRYTFSLSNMYNYGNKIESKQLQYWTAFAGVNIGKKRLSLSYVQQPETVICSGGVCRIEPAFNGVKANINIRF